LFFRRPDSLFEVISLLPVDLLQIVGMKLVLNIAFYLSLCNKTNNITVCSYEAGQNTRFFIGVFSK